MAIAGDWVSTGLASRSDTDHWKQRLVLTEHGHEVSACAGVCIYNGGGQWECGSVQANHGSVGYE